MPDKLLIGCDTGGTFTDFVMVEPGDGHLVTAKVSSTPDDPSRAILEGLHRLCQGRPLSELFHATTVATNTLLEGTTGRVGYLVTEGFGDSLWLGRGDRLGLYSLRPGRKAPPLRKEDVWEVKERADARGRPLLALSQQELVRLREELGARDDLQALAVCLLHSTLYPEHELALGQCLSGLPLFLSHRIAPSPGEYERGMTTLLAAALAPRVDRYIARLESAIQETPAGPETSPAREPASPSRLWIVHSAGGLLRPEEARQNPHRLALSGPAAGLRGALTLASAQGFPDIITLDMGGTSTDVALCHGAELPYTWETEIEGYPLRAPSLEIHTIGAGGGSVAFADSGGFLRVGPRSAGAQPGPACYGRGGDEPAVTDALCWAGYLPERLGEMPLRRQASHSTLQRLGSMLDLDADATALGVLSIAVSHLGLAVRKVSTGRGHDPQSFTLFPFGGAGPMLCCPVAESLGMRSILVPAGAGVLSAWGALTAPWEREWSAPVPAAERAHPEAVEARSKRLRASALAPGDERDYSFEALRARRYVGQGDTLVSAPEVDFHALHQARFGFQRAGAEVETVEVRWRCRARTTATPPLAPWRFSSAWTPAGSQQVLEPSGWTAVPIFTGELEPGSRQDGPFLHFALDSTLKVSAGWSALGLAGGHLLLTRAGDPVREPA